MSIRRVHCADQPTPENITHDTMNTIATHCGTEVWERLWRHAPTASEDREALEREAGSRRWARLTDDLIRTFGRIEALKVVELGSGRGDWSTLLAMRGARITLVDLNEAVLEQARRRLEALDLTAEYVVADLLDLPTRLHGRFDVSLSLGVVEHFRGPLRTRAIRAHHAVLVPSGMAFVGVPHAACIPYRIWKLYLELRGWWPYGMEIPYGKRELRRRAREAGFDRSELSATGWWQSIGDHWAKNIFHLNCDWGAKPSILDNAMGTNLVLSAHR